MALITFLIPTRNRATCLKAILRNFIRFTDQKRSFEVIVLDNGDVRALSDKELDDFPFDVKYNYSRDTLSVVDNFNRGVAQIAGDFACFIGDDDVVSEKIFDVAEKLKGLSQDAAIVAPKARSIYFWPGMIDKRWGAVGGKLYYSNYSGQFEYISAKTAIKSAKYRICDGPQSLPRAYSGLVSTRIVQAVVSRFGTLFGGCSPDIFSSRLLADEIEGFLAFDYPFIVAGASTSSTSGARSQRTDLGEMAGTEHLSRFSNLRWDDRIPQFYSPFTVWAQSYLEAEFLAGGTVESKSFGYLYAKCFLFAPAHARNTLAVIWNSRSRVTLFLRTFEALLSVLFDYAIEKVKMVKNFRPGGCQHSVSGLPDACAAAEELDRRYCGLAFSSSPLPNNR